MTLVEFIEEEIVAIAKLVAAIMTGAQSANFADANGGNRWEEGVLRGFLQGWVLSGFLKMKIHCANAILVVANRGLRWSTGMNTKMQIPL